MEPQTHKDNQSPNNSIINNRSGTIANIIVCILTVAGPFVIAFFMNGSFAPEIDGKEVTSSIYRNCLLYTDKDSVYLDSIGFFPHLWNKSRFTLKEVNLTYTISADSSTIISYRDDYKIQPMLNGVEVTNIEKLIYANSEKALPFLCFIMKDNGWATIDLKATYSGAKKEFSYHLNVYTKELLQEDDSIRQSIIDDVKKFLYSHKNIDAVDICILRNGKKDVIEEITIDNMFQKILQPENEHKPLWKLYFGQVAFAKRAPWYMYIVSFFLLLIVVIGEILVHFFAQNFIHNYKRGKSLFINILFIVPYFILSIPLFYVLCVIYGWHWWTWYGYFNTCLIFFVINLAFIATDNAKSEGENDYILLHLALFLYLLLINHYI